MNTRTPSLPTVLLGVAGLLVAAAGMFAPGLIVPVDAGRAWPAILLAVGAALLVVGAVGMRRSSRRTAPAEVPVGPVGAATGPATGAGPADETARTTAQATPSGEIVAGDGDAAAEPAADADGANEPAAGADGEHAAQGGTPVPPPAS